MKKIAFAIDTNSAGGAQRRVATLANYMARQGHDTYLLNSDTSSNFFELDEGVTVIKMGVDQITGPFGRPRRLFAKFRYLSHWLRDEQPDALLTLLFNMEVPAVLAGILRKTPVFVSICDSHCNFTRAIRTFRKLTFPRIAGVVLQSRTVRNFPDFDRLTNAVVIPNPLPVALTERVEALPYAQRSNQIIVAARLEEVKRPLLTAQAFAHISERHPDVELHFYGDGPLRSDIEHFAIKTGLSDRIFVHDSEPDALLHHRDARLFVIASHDEGFPNALLEAMAYGIPAISTDFDTRVARELIEDGVNGWLVPVDDEDALAAAMDHALALGPQTDAIAQRATAVFDEFNAERICRLWEEYLLHS